MGRVNVRIDAREKETVSHTRVGRRRGGHRRGSQLWSIKEDNVHNTEGTLFCDWSPSATSTVLTLASAVRNTLFSPENIRDE